MALNSKYNRLDVLVGSAVIVATLLLCYIAIGWINRNLLGSAGYVVYAEFASAGGLYAGDSVEIAGVKVGRVESVTLATHRARTALRITENVTIREDAIASIQRDWFIGDRKIAIDPGDASKTLSPGDEIKRTETPPSIQQLIGELFAGNLLSKE